MSKISIIIPAYNEARTVGAVVEVAKKCELVDEVIVVDDGSTDDTAAIALAAGAAVITLRPNRGKAGALDAGVSAAKNEIIGFLDADLKNFTVDALRRMIAPVIAGQYDMYAIIFDRRVSWLNHLVPRLPIISGNRALSRSVWALVPSNFKIRFQIELALNHFAHRAGKRCGGQVYPGLGQVIKEKKYGLAVGLWRRIKMMLDLMIVWTRLKFY